MKLNYHHIRIEHEKFGVLVNESFLDATQFKIFLKMVHGCLELKENLSFFNGTDFLVNVPHKYLVDSIIISKTHEVESEINIAEHFRSKMEMLVNK
jgi:hypothetical protein